ncbi:MAG: DUF4157 domain-containing protein [Deltaproteobacteria bacterium]|nr:DUF4157 domain-containing protein [Deltaproteobacteria bacterium]
MAAHSRKAKGPPPAEHKKSKGARKSDKKGPDNSAVLDVLGKRSGEELPPELRAKMESAFDFDFGDVRVHQDQEAEQVGALAFARGSEIHVKPGVYAPDTAKGKEIIGHELAHIVQQGGKQAPAKPMRKGDVNISRGLDHEADVAGFRAARGDVAEVSGVAEAGDIMRYTEVGQADQDDETWNALMDIRLADDGNMGVGQSGSYGSHEFWAVPNQINAANAILKGNKSVMRMSTIGETITGPIPEGESAGEMRTLNKVEVENVATGTKGDEMTLWADCGRSFRDVIGVGQGTGKNYSDTTAVYDWKVEPTPEQLSWIQSLLVRLGLREAPKTREATVEERETKASNPGRMKNEIMDAFYKYGLAHYEAFKTQLTPDEIDEIDKMIGINQHADPEIGEGFTMSSGGENYEGTKTWNFHWAGVVMKSGSDKVTLENYAVGDAEAKNTDWEFQMYGPPHKEGQTFHEHHLGTKQHGKSPTTMRVRKRKS